MNVLNSMWSVQIAGQLKQKLCYVQYVSINTNNIENKYRLCTLSFAKENLLYNVEMTSRPVMFRSEQATA